MILNVAAGGPWNGRPPRNSLLSLAETWTEKHCRAALTAAELRANAERNFRTWRSHGRLFESPNLSFRLLVESNESPRNCERLRRWRPDVAD
jgi:hypothetical protein